MLINGVVDLIIEREGYIEIVDYKTEPSMKLQMWIKKSKRI